MPKTSALFSALLASSLLAAAACGKKAEPPPNRPTTGAPVTFEAMKVTPGEDHKGAIDVRMYNFADKPVAQYMIMMRYHDASGAVLTIKKGTPFESDADHWSMSGMKYKCDPQSWCKFSIDHVDVPDGATKADVIATDVFALKDDGMHFEDKPLFSLADASGFKWPASAK